MNTPCSGDRTTSLVVGALEKGKGTLPMGLEPRLPIPPPPPTHTLRGLRVNIALLGPERDSKGHLNQLCSCTDGIPEAQRREFTQGHGWSMAKLSLGPRSPQEHSRAPSTISHWDSSSFNLASRFSGNSRRGGKGQARAWVPDPSSSQIPGEVGVE